MNLISWRAILSPLILLGIAPALWAQASSPHVGFVFPAGGQQGTTFEVKIGGQYLDGARSVYISGEGVEGKILGQTRPLKQGEIRALRKKLQDLQKKNPKTPDDKKEIKEIREKLTKTSIRPTPALAEVVTVQITIDPKAAPGRRDLRLNANTGMSNPLVFCIGDLPEVTQTKAIINPDARVRKVVSETNVTLPAVINSQIMPGQVDRYRFSARKGQQLVFITHARDLIPYLADAVPGWFQATLTLYDSEGNEVAYNDDHRNQPDPVLAFKVPGDGEYVLEIKDAIYRGREDFVYRIEAGELPFITNIFPLGGGAGTRTKVSLEGWNLAQNSLTLEPREMKPGLLRLSVSTEKDSREESASEKSLKSNTVPFHVSMLPDRLEKEANNTPEKAQPIKLPCMVNGQISQPGDWDVFRIQGLARQTIIAEVRARRLGSPLDSMLKLTDSKGKVLAYNDDQIDVGQGLMTDHADSLLRVKLPANGTYYLHVGDTQRHGSSAHAYRLRVSTPLPDFSLRVTPCSVNARPGSRVAITVYALRKDGFAGDIHLSLHYSPVDFSLSGARIPANQDEVRLILQVPATIRPKPVQLYVKGRARVRGRLVYRLAVPAEDMMQAFAYHHLVPAKHMLCTVSGKARPRFPARLLGRGPIKIRPGESTTVQVAIPRGGKANQIRLVLNDPPEGITLKKATVNNLGAILVLAADADKVTPGLRGNLIFEAYPDQPGKKARFPLGTLPAFPFVILRPR